jgi:membrane protease YdiL (CAAX protease family)
MWRRLPVWFRAVVLGLVVAGVPTLVWGALAATNLRFTPRLPWAAPVMAVLLWVYWRIAGGNGRREYLRGTPLPPRVWRLALLGGGSAVAAVWASFAALRGVLHVVPPAADIARFPIWTIFASIVAGSAVAGIAEEAGFRGYMQVPLERAYGPVVAIGTTSILFTLVHLTHGARILVFLPFYFVVAVVYGLLAYLTGSILPSMTLHFTGDVLMFTMAYLNARFDAPAAPLTGTISPGFAAASLAFAAFGVLMVRLLARERSIAVAA